ncbi:MAG: hypothetical protein ACYS8I_09925, partial [Planctomycetota bacterium]
MARIIWGNWRIQSTGCLQRPYLFLELFTAKNNVGTSPAPLDFRFRGNDNKDKRLIGFFLLFLLCGDCLLDVQGYSSWWLRADLGPGGCPVLLGRVLPSSHTLRQVVC